MEVDNSDWKAISQAIDVWKREGKISDEKAEELKQSFTLKKAGQQLAHYFFLIALSCTLMAFGAIFIDEKLLERFKIYFSLSNFVIALLMAALSAAWFVYVYRKRTQFKPVIYEIYCVLGGVAALASLVYICKEIGFGPSYSLFLFFAALMLFGLSVFFRSKGLWTGGILGLMGWFASFSYAYGDHHTFLGLNYPVRFTLFGLFVLGVSWLQLKLQSLVFTQRITYVAGLIIFFTGLWGVSIFGNYSDLNAWAAVRQVHVLVYAFIFGGAAITSLYLGIKYKDDMARDMGVLFLLLNFYSRYFEYFWDTMHKGLFFLLLAGSFWFVGKWIEKRRGNLEHPSN